MTKEYIKTMIKEIKIYANDDDDEKAHATEDALRNDFIKQLSERNDDTGKLAKLILSTNDIDFNRWCT